MAAVRKLYVSVDDDNQLSFVVMMMMIIIIMALQPFVGPWSLFSFFNL
jgi:hypothetical protein